jgi:hypothetical protein
MSSDHRAAPDVHYGWLVTIEADRRDLLVQP